VLVSLKLSFGILTSEKFLISNRGLKPHELMPMTGVTRMLNGSGDRPLPDGKFTCPRSVIGDVRPSE
jgi:hypothetical protein